VRVSLNGLSLGVVLSESEESQFRKHAGRLDSSSPKAPQNDTHCDSSHRLPRAPLIIAVLFFACTLVYSSAAAHPLGNFSISHYSGIHITRKTVEVRYVVDMAEIPTFQEIQETSIAPIAGDPSLGPYLTRKAESLRERLFLEVNGRRLKLQPESQEIIFSPGAGGLPTMKIGILYNAKRAEETQAGQFQLHYRDGNFPGRAGWKEIIATAEAGAKILGSSVAEVDRSSQLSNYPTDLLNSPPQILEARVIFASLNVPTPVVAVGTLVPSSEIEGTKTVDRRQQLPAPVARSKAETASHRQLDHATTMTSSGKATGLSHAKENRSAQLQPNRQSTPRNAFTELMATKPSSLGIILVALAVAVGLGAFHALEPGHGKTLVAAYLVGSRGSMRHALLLGLVVTAAHTAGVYLLGVITLYASQYVVPERLYPWLSVVSGVMIMALGLVLFARRYWGKEDQHHPHEHHSHVSHEHRNHDHHGHSHHRGRGHYHEEVKRETSLRELLTLGISGGIVPCPAALVVLLSAISMQRIGFGLLLIVAFSAGLAAVLIGIGLLMVSARHFMSRLQTNGELITRWLPLASSTIITLFGLGMVLQAIATAGYFSI
jgi:nickel/cobalt transporter (NicO) family protein